MLGRYYPFSFSVHMGPRTHNIANIKIIKPHRVMVLGKMWGKKKIEVG